MGRGLRGLIRKIKGEVKEPKSILNNKECNTKDGNSCYIKGTESRIEAIVQKEVIKKIETKEVIENREITEAVTKEKMETKGDKIMDNIAILLQVVDREIDSLSLEALNKALVLGKAMNKKVTGVLMGSHLKEAREEALRLGLDEIYVYEHKNFDDIIVEDIEKVLEGFYEEKKPEVIIAPSNDEYNIISAGLATKIDAGIITDVCEIILNENNLLVVTRRANQSEVIEEFLCKGISTMVLTIKKTGEIKAIENSEKKTESIDVNIFKAEENKNITLLESKKVKVDVPLEEAEIVVIAGNGFKEKKDLEIAKNLALELGGKFGVSRPLVLLGYAEHKYQVGITGVEIAPKILITLGVSGAMQFLAGIEKAKTVISVNTDKDAPIFKRADIGIVGDIYEVIPRVIELVKGEK